MSARTPLPPGKEGPRLGGLGGGLVAKAIPGPVRLWERHCPRAHVSWTRVPWSGRASKLGHIQHAGCPWGSREAGNWGPSLNAGQCPPPPQPFVWETEEPRQRESRARTRDEEPAWSTERGPRVKRVPQGFSVNAGHSIVGWLRGPPEALLHVVAGSREPPWVQETQSGSLDPWTPGRVGLGSLGFLLKWKSPASLPGGPPAAVGELSAHPDVLIITCPQPRSQIRGL